MISITDLSKNYGSQQVLQDINLELEVGAIHGLVGLNGAGKTSFLNCLSQIDKNYSGTIFTNQGPVTKKAVAYLQTHNYFYPYITGNEYLSLFNNPDFETDLWNSILKLPLHMLVDTYSTGMKKKLAFIGNLMLDKPLIILDEPFNGVDLETTQVFKKAILNLKENGKTVIITSHIFESLVDICDYMHHLEQGQIKASMQKENYTDFKKQLFRHIDSDIDLAMNKIYNKSSL